MDDRKDYVAPAIAWEDVLEQTSLACTATQPFPAMSTCFAGVPQLPNYAPGFQCQTDVSKGGAFSGDSACNIPVREPVVLS
jgi:hypothetical protein